LQKKKESARKGNPWSFEKYLDHATKIETPFLCTIGDYRVATGGIDKTACFKTIAGEIISGAISGNSDRHKSLLTDEEIKMAAAKKRQIFHNSRTENTYCGSDVLSAERRSCECTN